MWLVQKGWYCVFIDDIISLVPTNGDLEWWLMYKCIKRRHSSCCWLFIYLLRSTKENAYYSSPAGFPAGSVLDAMWFHVLGAILDRLAHFASILCVQFFRPGTGIYFFLTVRIWNIGELVFITGLFIVFLQLHQFVWVSVSHTSFGDGFNGNNKQCKTLTQGLPCETLAITLSS